MVHVYDEAGKNIGTMPREQAEDENHIRPNVLIFIFNSSGNVWAQLRPKDKKDFPGLWDISACGGIHSHEEPIEAAGRETEEETGGLKPRLVHVESFLNRFTGSDGKETARMSHLYIGFTDETPQISDEVVEFKLWDPIALRTDILANKNSYVPSFLTELDMATIAFNKAEQSK